MRNLTIGALVLVLLAGPAAAQGGPKQHQGNESREAENALRAKDADAVDRQYRSALDRTRRDAAPAKTDPWSTMRGPDDGKSKR